MSDKFKYILNEIADMCDDQRARWGDPNYSLPEWLSVITEEIGEAATEINDGFLGCISAPGDWLGRTRTELLQATALLVRMIDSIDARKHGGDDNES